MEFLPTLAWQVLFLVASIERVFSFTCSGIIIFVYSNYDKLLINIYFDYLQQA